MFDPLIDKILNVPLAILNGRNRDSGTNVTLAIFFYLLVHPAVGLTPGDGGSVFSGIIKQDAISPMACGPCASPRCAEVWRRGRTIRRPEYSGEG